MREHEIRPAELFAEYLRLSAQDAETYFSSAERGEIPCPGCGDEAAEHVFTKHGFSYRECLECKSLFQSPRPPEAEYIRFYNDSASSRYWAEVLFPAVSEARRANIFHPRVAEISRRCSDHNSDPRAIIDVGAGNGVFLEEWRKSHPQACVYAIEPGRAAARILRDKGIEVLETVAEEASAWSDKADLVSCFEVIEHVHDPLALVESLRRLVKPGGWILVTGLGVEGFDIQVLWEKSNSVCPPHHVNFLSVEGFKRLFYRAGMVDVTVETPGLLDVDIVANAIAGGVQLRDAGRFVHTLLSRRKAVLDAFQAFLSEHQLSSHCWVWARRPE